jgi:hypothetical protein
VSGELGAILRAGLSAVPARHVRTVQALIRCRTGELGYTVHACPDCGHQENIPRGCGNRHCPRCQGRLARAWLARQQADLLDTPYFHVVCTLPHALLPLCAAAPRELYALLFEAAAQTLLQLGRERLGGTIGLTAILHTWGQLLNLHPHLHLIVTGGALDSLGHWHRVKSRQYLFPVGVIGAIFRGKFLAGLTALKKRGAVPPPPGGWPRLWRQIGAADHWVVYCKRPFAGPESVLAYLANYTHRVAISERRIEGFDGQNVTFRWRDYANGSAIKHQTLPIETFVRRFCQHLLPPSFTKIRHYGILANHVRKREIPKARAAITRSARHVLRYQPPPPQPEPWKPACAKCGGTQMFCVALIQPDGRTIELPAFARLSLLRPRAPP